MPVIRPLALSSYCWTARGVCCLGEDEVFLIGDNRERSTDSRDYGPVLSGKLKGRVLVVG